MQTTLLPNEKLTQAFEAGCRRADVGICLHGTACRSSAATVWHRMLLWQSATNQTYKLCKKTHETNSLLRFCSPFSCKHQVIHPAWACGWNPGGVGGDDFDLWGSVLCCILIVVWHHLEHLFGRSYGHASGLLFGFIVVLVIQIVRKFFNTTVASNGVPCSLVASKSMFGSSSVKYWITFQTFKWGATEKKKSSGCRDTWKVTQSL